MNPIIIYLPGLNDLLNSIVYNDELPAIDVDYLLFVIIDIYVQNNETDVNNVLYNIMHTETISTRLDISVEQFVKLESTVYSLILLIKTKLNELQIYGIQYRYNNKRRTDLVTLTPVYFS